MKRFFIIIITVAVLMTACQQTPEKLVVQNKSDDELKQAISATAEPEAQLEAPSHIKDTITDDTGKKILNIDVHIDMPDVDKLPVAYVERDHFTQEQVDKMIEVFFKGATLYKEGVSTKADIEKSVLHLKQSATDLNSDLAQSNGIDNLEDLRELANERIKQYEKKWKTAPDTKPVIGKFDISSEDYWYATADLGKDDMAYLIYSDHEISRIEFLNFGKPIGGSRRYLETYSSNEIDLVNYSNLEFDKAKENALKMIEDMQINHMILGKASVSEDETHIIYDGPGEDPLGITNSKREFYVFCFEREINGVTIDNSFYNNIYGNNDDKYEMPLEYEALQIWTEGSEIVQLIWESPIKVTSMANDNVQVKIDEKQAIELMSHHAFIKYASLWNEYSDSVEINIDRIKLATARIKEKDTGKYVIVPVWDFYGDIKIVITEENENTNGFRQFEFHREGDVYMLSDLSKSIITVNALDGSILDRELGY